MELINEIPLCRGGGEDRWVWHYTKDGQYTVKSGCRAGLDSMTSAREGSSSSRPTGQHAWKEVWDLK